MILHQRKRSVGWFKRAVVGFVLLAVFAGCDGFNLDDTFETGLNQYSVGHYEEAVQNLIAYINTYPNHNNVGQALFLLASIYHLQLKNPSLAVRYYKQLIKSYKRSDYALAGLFYLGQLYYSEGDLESRRAISVFEDFVSKTPIADENTQIAKLYLAKLYETNHNEDQARGIYKELIETFTDTKLLAFCYYKIGKSFEHEGNVTLAQITYKEAKAKFGLQPALSSMLALAGLYEHIGEWNKAVQIYTDLGGTVTRNDAKMYHLPEAPVKPIGKRKKHKAAN